MAQTNLGISIKLIIILGIVALFGVIILIILEKYIKDTKYNFMLRMGGLALILNAIIFFFVLITFSHIQFAPGPNGPQGIRGDKGYSGSDGGLKVCGNAHLTAEELKFNIKSKELQLPQKPYIIE